MKVGCSYPVKWTDSKIYKATVHALGTYMYMYACTTLWTKFIKHSASLYLAIHTFIGSSSEMQDTIDALVSSDDNDHLQVDEEDSDYSMKGMFYALCIYIDTSLSYMQCLHFYNILFSIYTVYR